MNKLYHSFCVSAYKGGELHSNINQTIENIANSIDIDFDDIFECLTDLEEFSDMSEEEYLALTYVQFLDKLSDTTIKGIALGKLYPGNEYAYDSHSDFEIYTTNEEGELEYVDIVEEPGFMEAFRKSLLESAEYWDNRKE